MMQTDSKDDFPDARPLPHLANANGDAGGIMETETASTATVEDGNGHIPSDVSMKEDLQAPRDCKVMGKENSRGDDTENEPEKSDAGKQLTGSQDENEGGEVQSQANPEISQDPVAVATGRLNNKMKLLKSLSSEVAEQIDTTKGLEKSMAMTFNVAEWARELVASAEMNHAMNDKAMEPAAKLALTLTAVFDVGNKHLKQGVKSVSSEILLVATENAEKLYESRKTEYIAIAENALKQTKNNHKTHMSKMEMVYNSKLETLEQQHRENLEQQLRNQHQKHQKNQEKQQNMMGEVMQLQMREQ